MTSTVTLERRGPIGLLRIDNPPVNALDPTTVSGLIAVVGEFESDRSLAALLVHCDGRSFVAGGDIAQFERADFSTQPFNRLLARLEALDRPVVAALHGTALGGGLELALACHYHVAVPSAKVGLPEVLLGLLPGSLGTQRLPRAAGPELALDLMLSGRSIGAKPALAAVAS